MDNGKILSWSACLLTGAMLCSCASEVRNVDVVPTEGASQAPQAYAGLKHRLAVAKFEDKSGYGSNLFGQTNDVGAQASDILASHLAKTGEFVVLERQNLPDLEKEDALQNKASQLVGVSALIYGAVTELGTKTEWTDAGVSQTKIQTAHAKVTIRLVDPVTGVVLYSEFGEANARKESTQTMGFGSKASYDATLVDEALNGAIAKLTGNVLNNLRNLPWKAPVVEVAEGQVFIGAGKSTGLKIGNVLTVEKPGKQVPNPMTGAMMTLPGTTIGHVEVVSFFGNNEVDEGAVCRVVDKAEEIQKGFDVHMEDK